MAAAKFEGKPVLEALTSGSFIELVTGGGGIGSTGSGMA
jgi:hypothetical protein